MPQRSKRSGAGLPPRRTNHRISLAKAVGLTQRYRKSSPASEHGGFFWADALKKLLAQPDVVGVRFYHGLDERGRYRLVLVGVDSAGRDLLKTRVQASPGKSTRALRAGGEDAVILDTHWPCPPVCATDSPLN